MNNDVWELLASTTSQCSDAIRFACILEATAPKPGNVHPAARFADLSYADFVTAAELTADALGDSSIHHDLAATITRAVSSCVDATQTNVNLGIVLLLAPLVASEPEWQQSPQQPSADSDRIQDRCSHWQSRISPLLEALDLQQGAAIARAISTSGAGGLATDSLEDDHPLDVSRDDITAYDLIEAMRLAAPRDRIARQYADNFYDLFHVVVPTLRSCVSNCGDLLTGIVHAQIALIAADGDSLIARKCGDKRSAQVSALADLYLSTITRKNSFDEDTSDAITAIRQFDQTLRSEGNRLNPGTTADLIAAALYILLRTAG